METSTVRAVLFAKDLNKLTSFYRQVLCMACDSRDEAHAVLSRNGFDLIVHQIPRHVADGIRIEQPPVRREGGAIRLDYPVDDISDSRKLAQSFGGGIDETPPAWAGADMNFYLGFDPEGNVFGVSQQAARS